MELRLEEQTEWGWKIAVYLFLAGAGAGAYATGVFFDYFLPQWNLIPKIGVILGFPFVFVGTLFLILDLGVKMRALRAFLNPGTSWITRGTIIISVFMLLGFIHIVTWIWPLNLLEDTVGLRLLLGGINFIFAVLVMIYTGVLLGASRAIPLWSTAMLPTLFLVSAISTGILGLMLVLAIYGTSGDVSLIEGQIAILAKVDIFLLILELIMIAFYLQATHITLESRASANAILRGNLSGHFWTTVVIAIVQIPLLAQISKVKSIGILSGMDTLTIAVIVSILGLFDGLMLRHIVLAGGRRTPLRAAGIDFVRPAVRKT